MILSALVAVFLLVCLCPMARYPPAARLEAAELILAMSVFCTVELLTRPMSIATATDLLTRYSDSNS